MKKMIFLKVKNSYNKKLVTWLDLNLQVAHLVGFEFASGSINSAKTKAPSLSHILKRL